MTFNLVVAPPARGGKAGSLKPLKADDHAHKWTNVLDFIGNKQNFLLIPVFVFY